MTRKQTPSPTRPAKPWGSVHGRFQGLHLDHEEYILEAMSRCRHLFVGIARPDRQRRVHRDSPPHRADPANNPFSYYEREQMIRGCLLGAGYQESDFSVHPFPIDQPERIAEYLPPPGEISLYVTAYSDWSRTKADILSRLGWRVELLTKSQPDRRATGEELRQRLQTGSDISKLVSPGVLAAIRRLNLDQKLSGQTGPAPDIGVAGRPGKTSRPV